MADLHYRHIIGLLHLFFVHFYDDFMDPDPQLYYSHCVKHIFQVEYVV